MKLRNLQKEQYTKIYYVGVQVCKRAVTSDCAPACARSLAAPSCHRVKVVTPGQVCSPSTTQVSR